MKYLFDLTSLADNFSGIERFALCIARSFVKQFQQHAYVLVFKREVHSAFHEIAKQSNVECLILQGKNKLWFNQLVLPFHLYRICADAYLFLAFPEPLLFFHKGTYSSIHDTTCWDCGDTMPTANRLYFKASYIKVMKHSKGIITVSNFSMGRIMEIGKVNSNRIYNGVDDSFWSATDRVNFETLRQKYGLPEKYILTLCTLEPRKNLLLLLSVYNELIKQSVKMPDLVLAGRKGWKMEGLLSGFSTEIINRIHFTGFIDDADLPSVYQQAQFFIFPSKYEGFGIPPLEAMACGTLVLSSNATSLPEVLGDAAFYFHSENADSLKEMLLKVSKLPAHEYAIMIDKGHAQAKKFSWDEEARKLEALCQIR